MGVGFGMGNQMGNQMAGSQGMGGQQGGGPMPPPPPPQAPSFHYSGPTGRSQGLSAQQVAQMVQQNPAGKHHVWQAGWSGWQDAGAVPEIAAMMGPPPPPPQ